MEFNFNVKDYLKDDISKIDSHLIPEGFSGDRRTLQECFSRMNLLITTLGECSAKAQGLQKVITSGERLRNCDHTVYVLSEPEEGARKNAVLGMLKVGIKQLYVFDAKGNSHKVSTMCVLDFYVHESMQRMGLGKKLFDFMLCDRNVVPEHIAIDQPSPKFLTFLRKHYGLETIIPQMNNFVIFEGFFADRPRGDWDGMKDVMAAGMASSVLKSLGEELGQSNVQLPYTPSSYNVNQPQFGRHSAFRPTSTMGMILQQHSPAQTPSPGASRPNSISAVLSDPEPEDLESAIEELTIESKGQEVFVEKPSIRDNQDEAPVEEHISEATNEVVDVTASEPLACKLQAAHLDLKFYHSSLW